MTRALPAASSTAPTDPEKSIDGFRKLETGRYLQPEPLLQDPNFSFAAAKKGRSAPAYAYALNNPLYFVDRDGLDPDNNAMDKAQRQMDRDYTPPYKSDRMINPDCPIVTVPNSDCPSGFSRTMTCRTMRILSEDVPIPIPGSFEYKRYRVRCVPKAELDKDGVMTCK